MKTCRADGDDNVAMWVGGGDGDAHVDGQCGVMVGSLQREWLNGSEPAKEGRGER